MHSSLLQTMEMLAKKLNPEPITNTNVTASQSQKQNIRNESMQHIQNNADNNDAEVYEID